MYRLQKEKNINALYGITIALALLLAIGHMVVIYFDVTLSVVFYGMANIPSISYLVCHLAFMYIPLLLMIPNGQKYPKAMVLKVVLYVISACFLLGNTWVIYFIAKNPFSALFTTDAAGFQTFQRENALMFNYMIWNCYTPVNVIFSLINSALYFVCAKTIVNRKGVFRASYTVAFALSIIVPFLFKMFGADSEKLGLQDNIYLIGSQLFTVVSLYALSFSSRQWMQKLWTVAHRRY